MKKVLFLFLIIGALGIATGCDGGKSAETPKEFKPMVPGGPKAAGENAPAPEGGEAPPGKAEL